MPRGRKRAASPAPVEEIEEQIGHQSEHVDVGEEEADDEDNLHRLEFDEPLTWRAGKAIPVNELLRRLRTLYKELQSTGQVDAEDENSRKTFAPKAQELASPMLLGHKDRGVQAYTMLCIVEMFRLLAPHAPYTTTHLKNIFNVFVATILPALASPSDPYNALNHSILESLSTWQSIVLISDIPGSEQLILNLFTTIFDIVSDTVDSIDGDQISKNVEHHMQSMLITLVEQETPLPPGVVDVVLAQFLRADSGRLTRVEKRDDRPSNPQTLSPAYHMAQNICITAENMVRYTGHYFNAVLIDASEATASVKHAKPRTKKRNFDDSIDEDESILTTVPSEDDLQETGKAHRLLRELWRSCPDVIRNVMPQIEAELLGENQHFRIMAVQTIGDMIAGIGAAGPPPPMVLEPAVYPSQSSDDYIAPGREVSALLVPSAPYAFSSVYPQTYQGFMDRHRDKVSAVRSAWATAIGYILFTSGGGKGLDAEQESILLGRFSDMLVDQDEKVRLSAVQSIAQYDFKAIIQKLGRHGGLDQSGSILSNLADRAADPKPSVHVAALELLGRIWGVASGAIMEGNEHVRRTFGALPSHIMEAMYKNIASINTVVPQVLFDSLLPVAFPPIKSKTSSNDSQRLNENVALDPDKLRAERILHMLRDMTDKAHRVFSQLQLQSMQRSAYVEKILTHCEVVNKTRDGDAKESQKQISKLVEMLVRAWPNPEIAFEHLSKFFAHHDRRNYALVRMCYDPDSAYKRVVNAMKEIRKRLEDSTGNLGATSETVIPFLRSASVLIYNKSHVPAIMGFARSDDGGLGLAANETLKDIASKTPTVFKACIRELCDTLETQAPTSTTPNDRGAVDTLKACAGFARKFPQDLGANRKFFNAMAKMAMYGMPPEAAKHAVTIVVTSAEKKDMYIRDLMKHCVTSFEFGADHFLSRLAALGQLRLLANNETEDDEEAVTEIAAGRILMQSRTTATEHDPEWEDEVDDDIKAKLLALKVLVNGLRGKLRQDESAGGDDSLQGASTPIFKLLNTLVDREGELAQGEGSRTPRHHRSRLRLAAAKLVLKLCCHRAFDPLFSPPDFNRLIKIVQDPVSQVRAGFNAALKKYLGQNRLQPRFYGLIFLYAFEPNKSVKDNTTTWIRARALAYAQNESRIIEAVFPRFLSLLAHHDDFGSSTEDLADFVEYILFYLKNVASEGNLPHIYRYTQALKGLEDRIDPEKSENLYILSELSEAIIRQFQDIRGWSLQILPEQPLLPKSLFLRLQRSTMAQDIASKRFVPEDLADQLEDLVKNSIKSKKRKLEAPANRALKKAKQSTTGAVRSTPGHKTTRTQGKTIKASRKRDEDVVASADRRKSTRAQNAKSYAEHDDSEDDEELEQWQATSDVEAEANKENMESSTPPTSEPVQVPLEKSSTTKRRERVSALPTRTTRGRAAKPTKATRDLSDDDELAALE